MRYGALLNKYFNELYVYKIFSDGSRKKIITFKEINNFVYMDIRADNFKELYSFDKVASVMNSNMAGVDLNVLYNDFVRLGITEVSE